MQKRIYICDCCNKKFNEPIKKISYPYVLPTRELYKEFKNIVTNRKIEVCEDCCHDILSCMYDSMSDKIEEIRNR